MIRLPRQASLSIQITVGAALTLLVLRFVACEPYHIPSRSMENTLLVGDFLLVEKLSYGAKLPLGSQTRLAGWRGPQRGDIVVFRHPHEPRDYIKRCVALAGDVVELRAGQLWLNGSRVPEPYRNPSDPGEGFGPLRIPSGHVFVLGDHRAVSRDSRIFGPLPLANLRGRAALVYYSWDPQLQHVRWRRMPLGLL